MKALVLAAAVLACASAAHAQAPVSDYFSLDSRFDGSTLAAGTTIEAWDADGIRCGEATVNLDGGFLIHVNGNDTLTPAVDEGANPGEFLTWQIAGTAIDDNDATWIANIVGAFNDIRWENGAAKQIRLEARTTAIEVQTWTAMKGLYRP